jgi:GNAT superfamily N-acetyltransferase
MNGAEVIEIMDVTDEVSFGFLPPCADRHFDHRSCDYWEDEVLGSKEARPAWWRAQGPPPPTPGPSDNPFAPPPRDAADNPFAPRPTASGDLPAPLGETDGEDLFAVPAANPFAPRPRTTGGSSASHGPRKLRLLQRGVRVFGSYAKVLLVDRGPAGYAQFGPLSAFPRAQSLRDLYPQLPAMPLPAVITCIATASSARRRGLATRLVEAVCADLSERGFAAVEAYPDLTLAIDATSSATPDFWRRCGFTLAVEDERFPVMRLELT